MSAATSSNSSERTLYAAGFAWLLGCNTLAAACTPAQTTPVVATGQRVVTGNAEYDRFFAELSELLRGVEAAEHELPDAQAALARRVGIPEAAPADVLGARLRERTTRLALEGLTLELEFAGIDAADGAEEVGTAEPEATGAKGASAIPSQPPATPTATLRTPGREPERRELRLLEVLAQAALSAATVYAEMGTLPRRTRPLEENLATLRSQLAASFADASQRARVQDNLGEAAALIAQLNERARAVANAADTLISLLDDAANTANPGATARRRARREAPRPPSMPPPAPAGASPAADRAGRVPTPKGNAATDPTRDFEP
ncbi:MAG: hypothetical protein ABI895_04180 [Deltaproteobacteria bacterium]